VQLCFKYQSNVNQILTSGKSEGTSRRGKGMPDLWWLHNKEKNLNVS
jgi:hypothetical protein